MISPPDIDEMVIQAKVLKEIRLGSSLTVIANVSIHGKDTIIIGKSDLSSQEGIQQAIKHGISHHMMLMARMSIV